MSHGKSYEATYPYQTWRITPPPTRAAQVTVCRKAGCSSPAGIDDLCQQHGDQQTAMRAARLDGRTGARL